MYLVEIIYKNATSPVYQYFYTVFDIDCELAYNENVEYYTIFKEVEK